jgi:uncharacterized protein (DUF1697 family)
VGTTQYVALLRGINVGGRNKVPMAELREAFEAATVRSGLERDGRSLLRAVVGSSYAEPHVEHRRDPRYQQMTIRSWKTTKKLLGLLDERRQ